jgi:peptidoglycan/LPS O-acetylase OafA/YrhL
MIIYIAYCKIPYINNFGKYGDFSYGMYLWAFPVSQILICFWQDKFNVFTYIVSVFFITLFIAVLSFKFIEKPALKLKNKKILMVLK